MLRQSRLEHGGERADLPGRRQVRMRGPLEGLGVGAVRQHGVVQAHAAGQEAAGLGIVDAFDEPHEFRHQVHMVPRRTSWRSAEHTSELQSLMRLSYAVSSLTQPTKFPSSYPLLLQS